MYNIILKISYMIIAKSTHINFQLLSSLSMVPMSTTAYRKSPMAGEKKRTI